MRSSVAFLVMAGVTMAQDAPHMASEDIPSWDAIFRQTFMSIAEAGPVMAFTAAVLGGIAYSIVKWVAPWAAKKVDQALEESQQSREQRKVEADHDLAEKRALMEAHQEATASHERITRGHEDAMTEQMRATIKLVASVDSLADKCQALDDGQRDLCRRVASVETHVARHADLSESLVALRESMKE